MADRGKGKAGRLAVERTSTAAASVPRTDASKKVAKGPAAEIERLSTELAAAQTRIAELERQRTEAINRIDWVIDALQGLIEPHR